MLVQLLFNASFLKLSIDSLIVIVPCGSGDFELKVLFKRENFILKSR